MAMGRLSSLGVGSNVLNYDTIDKLKKVDEKSMIEPIDKKMKENIEKQAELASIIGMLGGLNAEAKVLSDYSSFIGRKTDVIGEGLRATASPGVPIQDIEIQVKQVAKNDVNEVGTKFESRESVFTEEDTLLTFTARGHTYKIKIPAGTTVQELAQLVTDKSGGNAIGLVMKTGGANPYQLMINSKETGEENRIYFGSTLQSEKIQEGPISLGEGDLEIVFKDSSGLDQSLMITLPQTPENSKSSDNAQAIKQAIKDAIEQNADLADLLGGDLNVSVGVGGNSLVLNDRRGYQIQVLGNKAKELGFKKTESDLDPIVLGNKPVEAGVLEGKISVGSVPLDLSELTSRGNTGPQNAQAIADAFNNIGGLSIYVDESGRLVVNANDGDVSIKAEDEEGKKALAKLGLKEGRFAEYSKTQEGIFKLKNLQAGQDAELIYDGVKVVRPKNTIDDIVGGVKLEIVSPTPEGKNAIVSITPDYESLIENLKTFTEKYNELMPKLTSLTNYDPDTGIAGIFNGVSFIRSIKSSVNQIFSAVLGSGADFKSLIKYGLSLDDNSKMSFDESKFRNAITADPEGAKDFFVGMEKNILGRDTRVGGVFRELNERIDSMIVGSNASLKLYEQNLTRDEKRYKEDRKKTMERLNARYDSMAERFAAYDGQIAKTNNSFNSVQMMIDQAKKK